jgi:hypothetical protein
MTTSKLKVHIAGRNAAPLLVAAGLTALALSLSGCEQGIGGGAAYPLHVSILPDADAEQTGPAAAADVEVAGYGTLRGRVVLEGSVSVPGPITPTKDAFCIAQAPIPNDRIQTGADGGLANVFIYLPNAPGGTRQPESVEPIKFDQVNCRFVPHCMTMQTGQTILVLNDDETLHNTHTNPQRQPAFNQGVAPKERNGVPLVYSRSERIPVSVICDIHPWMLAFHMPLDHPYNVITAEDGSFEIADLPAGTHQFTIWHEVPGVINNRYAVEIPVDGTAEVEIKVPAQQLARFNGPQPKQVVLSMTP